MRSLGDAFSLHNRLFGATQRDHAAQIENPLADALLPYAPPRPDWFSATTIPATTALRLTLTEAGPAKLEALTESHLEEIKPLSPVMRELLRALEHGERPAAPE